MAQAIIARRDGDTFQARLFWRKAARLLVPGSPIVRIGFEKGPKGFDDIWVEYDPQRSPPDQEGEPLRREHWQCKWHVTPATYGYTNLIDPAFINANARSFLQRAHEAQRSFAPNGTGTRFKLVTNWRVERRDALRPLIRTRSGTIHLERLFDGSSDSSAAAMLRKAWRDHLGITETDLRVLVRTLGLGEVTDSLDELRDNLDLELGYAGLRRVPANESAFIYDDVIFQWMAQGRLEFDKNSLRTVCKGEGLLAQNSDGAPIVFGVKSFEHPIDRLEERCIGVLDLIGHFDDRQIRSDSEWQTTLYPALRRFLLDAAKGHERIRLALDAHVTLAVAAGSILNIKSGRKVELEQRTIDRRIWSADDAAVSATWPGFVFMNEQAHHGGKDLAIAVGLTHDVGPAVRAYVKENSPTVGTLLVCSPSTGPSARSVVCGAHAFALAETLTAYVKQQRETANDDCVVHVFLASPNAFSFFLGQRQAAIGRVCLYEFDFEGGRDGSYCPSLTLPVAEHRA